MLTGALIEVPALTAAIWVLAELGVGNPDVPVMRVLRLTAAFAGVAAVFTAGGIGRVSAYASLDGGRRHAVFVAARTHAVASAGLVVIAAIPHGQLPGSHSLAWLAFPAAGLVAGAGCGAVIGLLCGGKAPVEFADVWSLAKKPSEALRSWLDPRELVRLGAAVRDRTTNLFEGIFEPAPLPPHPPPALPSAAAPAAGPAAPAAAAPAAPAPAAAAPAAPAPASSGTAAPATSPPAPDPAAAGSGDPSPAPGASPGAPERPSEPERPA
jgi:hypothetical protein